MAGYLGAVTVGLDVTSVDVKGDITSTDASPEVTLQNTTEEDTDGGRESKITFKGEQSGGEITTLAQIQASHDGTADDEKGDLIFSTNDGADGNVPTERVRIDSAGNVGIGTSSPSEDLTIASTSPQIRFEDTDASGTPYSKVSGVLGNIYIQADDGNEIADSKIDFRVDGVQRAIIDSSGNLLVGKTSTGISTQGVFFGPNYSHITSTNDTPLALNRKSSDGTILDLRKDGTTVGSIGAGDNDLIVGKTDGGFNCYLRFGYSNVRVIPSTSTGGGNDNLMDLGDSSSRFDDIYATNGTIQTSDQNEKQQIASLSDAEITAAKAISKLFKTFKWNDSVEEKGDAARTHTGVIAQEVEQAMTDAGLNAGDYAFFISTTWWETQTEVPAVEAVDEVLDEDGNVITEAVEAQEAYTRTDTYDTAEEAPEGATERNRKGIRYPQLLSFIGAATEQRLASIESRLDALESA